MHIKRFAALHKVTVNTVKNHIKAENLDSKIEDFEIYIIMNFKAKRFVPHKKCTLKKRFTK